MALLKKIVLLAVIAALLFAAPAFAAGAREKVLLDTDMVESFDDGVAMIECARKFFDRLNEVSANQDRVKYDVVHNYAKLLDIVRI